MWVESPSIEANQDLDSVIERSPDHGILENFIWPDPTYTLDLCCRGNKSEPIPPCHGCCFLRTTQCQPQCGVESGTAPSCGAYGLLRRYFIVLKIAFVVLCWGLIVSCDKQHMRPLQGCHKGMRERKSCRYLSHRPTQKLYAIGQPGIVMG